MTIYIDINHPAHVHYFRNFIKKMEEHGHCYVVTNRDDNLINYLLDFYKIDHIIRNKRKNNSKSKLTTVLYLLVMTFHVWRNARKHKVDAFLGFASSSCAISGFLLRKPSVLLDDTEHNKFNHSIYKRFATLLLTPYYFKKEIRSDQVYFDAYVEQLYLSNNKIAGGGGYIFLRFIAYDASHDANVDTSNIALYRNEIINKLKPFYKLIISCESEEMQQQYSEYVGNFNPEEIHEVMRKAELVISDGATMASEAGVMGVPYVYTNPLFVGYVEEQTKTLSNAYRMSYAELNKRLELDIEFYKKDKLISNDQVQLISPTHMLVRVFSDLRGNIPKVKGKRIDGKFLENL